MSVPIASRMVGYWNGSALPDDIALTLESWHTYGPQDIEIYSRESAIAFIEKHYGIRERDAFLSCKIPAMQADVFRCLELLKFGGFYLDMGIELLAPPTMFMNIETDLVLYRRWHGRIVNGMFACQAGNPILAEICEKVIDNVTKRVAQNVWLVSGPGVWYAITDNGNKSGITVFDHETLAEKICRFNQNLAHKKDGKHWSAQQDEQSIYND